MPRLLDESFTARRLARRLGWRPSTLRARVPARPVGAKLELTHSCNLRCGFCYTDSPRQTLMRPLELSDEQWHDVAEQAADLGVIEVVLSGGEPFLRRDLVLALLERLAPRGIGLTLNTNGWFIDDDVADRLAAFPGLGVHISIDGATPALHDASRGVPGSWRRAIEAASRLLDRGVKVQIVQVVTPDNQHAFPDFLQQMFTLGVRSVRATPVVQVGAAARSGDWAVNRARLRRTARDFRRRHGEDMRVVIQHGNAGVLAVNDEAAPAALLVRPSGAVLMDSLHPFAFGRVPEDSLGDCWARIAGGWRDPRISGWAASLRNSRDLPDSSVVPYLDDEVPVAGTPAPSAEGAPTGPRAHAQAPVPAKTAPRDDSGDHAENLVRAQAHVRRLALSRRYRLGAVRMGGGPGDRHVRVADGRVSRLNGTAALLADTLADRSPAEAVDHLAGQFADVDRERLEGDVLATSRALSRRGILVPSGAVD